MCVISKIPCIICQIEFDSVIFYDMQCQGLLLCFLLLYFKILIFLVVLSRFLTMDDSFLLENRAILRAMYVIVL
jgi:hypothetical protein